MTNQGTWLRAAVLLGFLAACNRQPAQQREVKPPNDSTALVEERRKPEGALEAETEPRGEEEKGEFDADDPGYRLDWERAAWGESSADFRSRLLRLGAEYGRKKYLSGPRWVNVGPTGARYEQNGSFTGQVRDSGRMRTILPHPFLSDVVYVLTSGGGLWVTTNWSSPNTRWTVLTDDLPTTGGGAVAFGKYPTTLYLGLGDPYDQITVGGAMVRSTTAGLSWSAPVELGAAVSVRDVKVDTSGRTDVVFAATDVGLFRSADGGTTYASVPALDGQSVWSIQKTSAGWLVAAQPCPVGFGGLQCPSPTTLWLSTDKGATFAPIANTGGGFTSVGRTTLAAANPGEAVVYAYSSTVGDAQMADVFRSNDGGVTWLGTGTNSTKIPTNPVAGSMANMNICQSQCWYDQMIVVDPRDASRGTLWIGGNLAAAQSKDGGATWTLKSWWLYEQVPSLPYAHADYHAAAFKTTGTPTLILGNDGGMNTTTDDGATFSSDKNNGLATHLYYTITGNPKLPNAILGGLQDNGTRLRSDNGTIHDQVIGGDGMGAAWSQDNTNTVIGSSQGSSMRTNQSNNVPDRFQNWAGATSGLSDVGFGFFTSITPAPAGLDPTGKVFFHFSNSRVWRSNNGGLTWTRIGSAIAPTSTGLPTTRRFRSSPYNLGVSPTDLNRIAVGAGGGFLDVTTDGGATWTDLNLIALVPGYQGFVTNVTWQDNQHLWVTSVAQAAGAVRVLKGTLANPTDSWATAVWTPMTTGLPDLPVTRILFDPRDATRQTIYAATHVGVYASKNGGASWALFGTGLPAVRVNDIYMPPDGGSMRIATYGRGVWELPQVEFVSAVFSDRGEDDDDCDNDHDGVLDNGERGHLAVKVLNQGYTLLRNVKITVTSSNPHVTFPKGNVVYVSPLEGRDDRTRFVKVALAGAVGVETVDYTIRIEADAILPGGYTVTSTQRVNYDEVQNASATDTFDAKVSPWVASGGATTMPNIAAFQFRALSPTQNVLWGPDNNGQNDGVRPDGPDEQMMTSPVLKVGTDPLTISFSHRFSFENGGWDGGVVEISNDGGATWASVPGTPYNGALNTVTSAPIGAGRPAFVNRMVGWPAFANVTIDAGTAFAGQDVRIRFRTGSDESTGAPGWEIGNLVIGGLTNTPFPALVPNASTAVARTGAVAQK
ncbi:MAG: hypothetical protein U0229_06300 [Anaeromyxobacter sp.]